MKCILENKKSRELSLGIVPAGMISAGIFIQSSSRNDEWMNGNKERRTL
jgi:hypothetical protein